MTMGIAPIKVIHYYYDYHYDDDYFYYYYYYCYYYYYYYYYYDDDGIAHTFAITNVEPGENKTNERGIRQQQRRGQYNGFFWHRECCPLPTFGSSRSRVCLCVCVL